MTDKLPHHDDQDGGERGPEADFFEKLRTETDQRREFADAFAHERTSRPTLKQLLEHQHRQADLLAQLDRSMGRLARGVLVANILVGVIAVTLLAGAAYFYSHPFDALSGNLEASATASSPARQETSIGGEIEPDLVFAEDPTFFIRTEVDRKYQIILRELYGRLVRIRRPSGEVPVRNAMVADYIQFVSDVSRILEEAGQEGVSPEIMTAIGNLVLVGKELRSLVQMADLDVESKNKLDQIRAVLRAPDTRGQNSETGLLSGSR